MRNISFKFKAKNLYQYGTVENLRYSREKSGIVLNDSVLVEDDAPGKADPGQMEAVSPMVWIKKELFVDDPSAFKAWLLVYNYPSPGSGKNSAEVPAVIQVNTTEIRTGLQPRWNYIEVDPEALKKGNLSRKNSAIHTQQ